VKTSSRHVFRRRTAAGPLAGAAALKARLNAMVITAQPPLLPVGQTEFTQCSNAIASFAATPAHQLNGHRMLPFPSSVLPPPL
jgi:hypothetical protein